VGQRILSFVLVLFLGRRMSQRSEIEDDREVRIVVALDQEDIVGLEIAVDDPLLMRFVNSRANLFENIHDPLERQTSFFDQDIAERATVEVLHHQIGQAIAAGLSKTKISDVDNIWMAQASGCARFAFETFDELVVAHEVRSNQLESDKAFRAQVCGQIDGAHATLSEQSLEVVFAFKDYTDVTFQASHEAAIL